MPITVEWDEKQQPKQKQSSGLHCSTMLEKPFSRIKARIQNMERLLLIVTISYGVVVAKAICRGSQKNRKNYGSFGVLSDLENFTSFFPEYNFKAYFLSLLA